MSLWRRINSRRISEGSGADPADEIKSTLRGYSKKYEVDEEPMIQPDGSLSISIRDWDLPKEQPEEYPQDDDLEGDDEGMGWHDHHDLVKATIKKHTEALLRRLPTGTSVEMELGDKNYLEATIRPPKAEPKPVAKPVAPASPAGKSVAKPPKKPACPPGQKMVFGKCREVKKKESKKPSSHAELGDQVRIANEKALSAGAKKNPKDWNPGEWARMGL